MLETIPAPYHLLSMPLIHCGDGDGANLSDLYSLIYNTAGYDNIYWFSTINQEEGTELDPFTEIVEGVIYYAFQVIDYSSDCVEALEVTVQLENSIPPVTGDSDQYFCANEYPTVADLVAYNTEGYDYILWYSVCCPISESEALDPSTLLEDDVVYYAHQGISNYCEYGIFSSTVHLENVPAPTGENIQVIESCEGVTLADLEVYNTEGYDTIFWSLNPDGYPLVSETTIVENDNTYYAFQGWEYDHCSEPLAVTISCSIGVSDAVVSFFEIAPNPIENTMYITSTYALESPTFTLVDNKGQQVYKSKLFFENNKTAINLSTISTGVYSVVIETKTKKQSVRVVLK